MKEEFLNSQLLWNTAVRISTEIDALLFSLHTHYLYIRLKNRLITYHPNDLINEMRVRDCILLNLYRIVSW